MSTYLIGGGLLLVVIAIIWRMAQNKRRGKSGCGCGCDSCPGAGICHPGENQKS